jgi:hypothetical protein
MASRCTLGEKVQLPLLIAALLDHESSALCSCLFQKTILKQSWEHLFLLLMSFVMGIELLRKGFLMLIMNGQKVLGSFSQQEWRLSES